MITPLIQSIPAASTPRQLAHAASTNPLLLNEVLQGLNAMAASIKYGCAKALRLVAESRPEVLYPHFDLFVSLLDAENHIMQWEGVIVLSHLARVDGENQFDALFDKYFSPIPGPVMITAANVIQGGARIARARPHWADRIAREVLKVSRAQYRTAECRNVAIGHAILALSDFFDLLHDRAPVLAFVRRQLKNSRPATRKKAEQFLRRTSQ